MDFTLETYIKDISTCDKIIDFFHNSEYANKNRTPGVCNGGITNETVKKSTDLSIYSFNPAQYKDFPVLEDYVEQLKLVSQDYCRKFPFCYEYGVWNLIEPFNIQWYKPGEGFFCWHTERNESYPNNDRCLVWMTYLNDVEEGGGTEFYHQKHIVKAKKGKTLIWPADWNYTHRGQVAPHEHKYVITGWFSYDRF